MTRCDDINTSALMSGPRTGLINHFNSRLHQVTVCRDSSIDSDDYRIDRRVVCAREWLGGITEA